MPVVEFLYRKDKNIFPVGEAEYVTEAYSVYVSTHAIEALALSAILFECQPYAVVYACFEEYDEGGSISWKGLATIRTAVHEAYHRLYRTRA